MKTGIYTERGRGKIERGREKIIGKKEENSSPPVGLEPTTLLTWTRALPLVLRGSLKW